MKLIRCLDPDGQECWGRRHDDGATTRVEGSIPHGFVDTDTPVDVSVLLAPVQPAVILGIGLNYVAHVKEIKNRELPTYPVLFMKAPTAVAAPGQPIRLPRGLRSDQVDYEGELAVVIGRTCRNVPRERALEVVLGYTCANDVSARDWQKQYGGGQWCRGKTFDTFCPLGPWLVTGDEMPDPQEVRIRTRINDELRQDGNTRDMIFPIADLIAFLSGSTTLAAGTVILTGTPHGVAMGMDPPPWLQPGDVVSVEVEGIGTLVNPVEEETG